MCTPFTVKHAAQVNLRLENNKVVFKFVYYIINSATLECKAAHRIHTSAPGIPQSGLPGALLIRH